jgi:MFS family permease
MHSLFRVITPVRLAIIAAFFSNGFLTATWIVHIPQIKQVLHLSDGQLGLILWGAAIGLFVGILCGNPLIGRFGSRNLTGVSAILLSLLVSIPVLSPSRWLIFTGLFMYGFFNAALDVAMNAQAAYLERGAKRAMMSSFHGFWSIGGFAGGSVGGLALKWEVPAWIHISLCAIVFVSGGFWIWGRLPEIAEDRKKTEGVKIAFPGGILFPIGLVCLISILAEGVVADWAGVLLRGELNIDAATAALPYAFFLFAMAIVRFLGDRIVERFGPIATMTVGLSAAVAGLLIAIFIHHLILDVIGFALVGLGLGNAVPVLFSAAGKIGRPSVAYAISAVATAGYVGLFTGPALIGSLAQAIQLPNAFLVVTGSVAAGALIVLGPIRKSFAREAASEKFGAESFGTTSPH